MNTGKIIAGIFAIAFISLLLIGGNKFGSSEGRKAAAERLRKESGTNAYSTSGGSEYSSSKEDLSSQEYNQKNKVLLHNMKQIAMELLIFEIDYGYFPNYELNETLKKNSKHPDLLDPKDIFSQLLATGVRAEFIKTPRNSSGEWIYFGPLPKTRFFWSTFRVV